MQEQSLFIEALEIDVPAEQAAFLDRACAGDAALRQRIERLLHCHQQDDSFLQGAARPLGATSAQVSSAEEAASATAVAERPGSIIGPYKLLEQIGEGGMGLVFMAEQQQPVRRNVALKILKPGMDTRQVIARFEAERQALALMDHPNIARVLDAGETASGRPHFVMELVRGVSITDYCDQNRLNTRERLELFTHVCQAVQHAHHKGIIHRDIKPSNVMVTLHDDVPVVKVIDFGIAKALGRQLTEKTLVTGFAQMVGTPMYMSPEQAALSGLDIDTRSDIYSLGVLLYVLLTGTTPYDKERLRTAGYDEIRRIIREEEPARPSTRLSTLGQAAVTVSERRQSDPKRLSLLLRGELDWIVIKALDKDRTQRYETASAFAADVERHLRDEPVLACPPSAWYRCRKFTRRHKVALRTAVAAAIVLLSVAGGSAWMLRDQAMRQAELSQRTTETERTVNEALVTAGKMRDQAGKMPRRTSEEAEAIQAVWQQAEAALAPALAALNAGTANNRLRQQVRDMQLESERQRVQAQRKAKLLRDLNEARMTRSIWIETHFDYAGSAMKYVAAFAAYDLEMKPERTQELARRIRAEEAGIREALIVAIDDWSDYAIDAQTALLAKELQALAGAVDDDAWRQKCRAAPAKDATALRALSREARQLALQPSSLVLLTRHLAFAGERDECLSLLRWARVRYPGDFWVQFALGQVLITIKQPSELDIEETIGCFSAALALRPKASAAYCNLGVALWAKNQAEARDAAIYAFKQALIIDPKLTLAHRRLGNAFRDTNQLDEAIAEYRQIIKLSPNDAEIHNNLGNALNAKKQLEEAMVEYRQAIKINPNLLEAHYNLGNAFRDKTQWDEAMVEYRKAIDIDLECAPAHYDLGNALFAKKQWDEASAEFRKAIYFDPKHARAYNNLGLALNANNQLDEAMVAFRKAIEIDPKCAPAHLNLGTSLRATNQLDEAIVEFRKAIDCDPKYAAAYNNLGLALKAKNQLDEAMVAFRKAIEIDPKCAPAHYNIGLALSAKKQWDEASVEYRKVIDLRMECYAEAHCILARDLRSQGQLSASLDFYKRGHALGSKREDWHYPSAQWVVDAERLVRLDAKLFHVLTENATPADNRERLGLLEVCQLQHRHVAAARLYVDAFTADPTLTDDLKARHRYHAACCAALAAAGQGMGADKLDDQEKSRLRKLALAWLRADLDVWSKRLEDSQPAARQATRQMLQHWQGDTDLNGVRDADGLKELSAEEREAWRKLWADVAEVLKNISNAK